MWQGHYRWWQDRKKKRTLPHIKITLPQVRKGGDEKQRVTLLFLGQMWQIHKFAGKDMEKMWQGHNFCNIGK